MTLQEIVKQLEWCGYECEAGTLVTNVAFISLKELAEKEAAQKLQEQRVKGVEM